MKCFFINHDMRYVRCEVFSGGMDGGVVRDVYKCIKCGKEELRAPDR